MASVYLDDYDDYSGELSFRKSSEQHLVTSDPGNQSSGLQESVPHIFDEVGAKTFKDFKLKEWLHLVVAIFFGICYLMFSIYLMYKYLADSDQCIFSVVILMQCVFANFFLFHGLFKSQPFQIVMEVLTVLCMWILDLIYHSNISHNFERFPSLEKYEQKEHIFFYARTTIASIVLVSGLVVAWNYWFVEQVIFKTVGINTHRVNAFRGLFLCFSLMIFDLETSLATLFLFLRNGLTSIVFYETLMLSAGILFMLVWIIIGYKAVRKENRALTYAFYATSAIQPIYLIFLFLRNIKWMASSEQVLTSSSHVVSFIALSTHLSLVATMITVHHYHGNGYADILVNGVRLHVRNSKEYADLRKILFHPARLATDLPDASTSAHPVVMQRSMMYSPNDVAVY